MLNFIRFRTAYSFDELEFPECFARAERDLEDVDITSELVNVVRRMGDVDFFAWQIREVMIPGNFRWACPAVSSYLTAHFGSCKALFDSVALFLTTMHKLDLRPEQQDFHRERFWTALKSTSDTTHVRYSRFRPICGDVVKWRNAAIHRAAPLAILHIKSEDRDAWRPDKGSIKVVDDPDWRGTISEGTTKWMDPLDKHRSWRPQFIELCEMICDDQKRIGSQTEPK